MDNTPLPADSYGWCLIPPTIIAREDLSLREKFLVGRLLGLMTTTGYCYASNAWIGAQLDIKKDTVSHLLTSLVRKNLINVELIKNSAGQIIERRIYPLINPNIPAFLPSKKIPKRATKKTSSNSTGGGVSYENPIPIGKSNERGIGRMSVYSDRDKSVEKSVSTKEGETSSPPGFQAISFTNQAAPLPSPPDLVLHIQSVLPMDLPSAAPVSSNRPPYLPRQLPLDHPACQVLTTFDTLWETLSQQRLDITIPRALKEIRSRLLTTPLPDLLQLVDLWFKPGLSWVTEAERGCFHSFIQPGPISELKGLKAGLSTLKPKKRTSAGANGYHKPLTHEEWKKRPSGEYVFKQ